MLRKSWSKAELSFIYVVIPVENGSGRLRLRHWQTIKHDARAISIAGLAIWSKAQLNG